MYIQFALQERKDKRSIKLTIFQIDNISDYFANFEKLKISFIMLKINFIMLKEKISIVHIYYCRDYIFTRYNANT